MRFHGGIASLVVCAAALAASGKDVVAAPAEEPGADVAPPGQRSAATPSAPNVLVYGVDAGIGETDNVQFASTGAISQTIATVDGDVLLKQRTALFDDEVKGQFNFYDYLQHAYGSEFLGRLDATAHLAIVPERLVWLVQEDFGEATLDPFSQPVPTNFEYVESLATGPELTLRFGPVSFMKLDARYTRIEYQTSPFNSNRFLGSAQFGLSQSARSTLSLNANAERVLYQNTLLNTDLMRSSAYAAYEVDGARTDLSARFGVTRVDEDGITTSGSLASFSASRIISPAATLTLAVGRDLTDASASFANLQSGATNSINTSQAAVTSSIYTLTSAQLSWRYARNRTTLALSGRWEKDSYGSQASVDVVGLGTPVVNATEDPQALDFSRRGGEFSAEQQLSRTLSAQLLGSYYDSNYPHANFSATAAATDREDSRVGTALIYRKGRGLELKFRYDHIARVISGVGSGSGFRGNAIYLTVGYRPAPKGPVDSAP